jgi:hypothetical protein
MGDKFLIGMALGMLGGAVIVANSIKIRKAIKDGQEQIVNKAKELQKNQKKKS